METEVSKVEEEDSQIGDDAADINKPVIEKARTIVIRNLLIGLIMVLAIIAVSFVIQRYSGVNSTPTTSDDVIVSDSSRSLLPTDKLADDVTSEPAEGRTHRGRWKLVKPSEDLLLNSGIDPYLLMGFEIQPGSGNVFPLTTDGSYQHSVVISPEYNSHIYYFTNSCGHQSTAYPDPYADLVYEEVQKVVEFHAGRLCRKCQQVEDEEKAKESERVVSSDH